MAASREHRTSGYVQPLDAMHLAIGVHHTAAGVGRHPGRAGRVASVHQVAPLVLSLRHPVGQPGRRQPQPVKLRGDQLGEPGLRCPFLRVYPPVGSRNGNAEPVELPAQHDPAVPVGHLLGADDQPRPDRLPHGRLAMGQRPDSPQCRFRLAEHDADIAAERFRRSLPKAGQGVVRIVGGRLLEGPGGAVQQLLPALNGFAQGQTAHVLARARSAIVVERAEQPAHAVPVPGVEGHRHLQIPGMVHQEPADRVVLVAQPGPGEPVGRKQQPRVLYAARAQHDRLRPHHEAPVRRVADLDRLDALPGSNGVQVRHRGMNQDLDVRRDAPPDQLPDARLVAGLAPAEAPVHVPDLVLVHLRRNDAGRQPPRTRAMGQVWPRSQELRRGIQVRLDLPGPERPAREGHPRSFLVVDPIVCDAPVSPARVLGRASEGASPALVEQRRSDILRQVEFLDLVDHPGPAALEQQYLQPAVSKLGGDGPCGRPAPDKAQVHVQTSWQLKFPEIQDRHFSSPLDLNATDGSPAVDAMAT